jgi:hypothetical protein
MSMPEILKNKKSLTFLSVAILILVVLASLLLMSFSFLLASVTDAISDHATSLPPVHFNLPAARQ